MTRSRSIPVRVAIAAGVLGVIGFIGGIVVPIILDPTTVQGPLLGIFMTGPLGVILGGEVGVLWSARHQKQTTWTEFRWLVVFGGLGLLLYEFFARLAAFMTVVPASAFLITALTAAALLMYVRGDRALQRRLVAVSIAAPLLFVAALFPPVRANPIFRGARPSATTPPHFLFLLSSQLDTRSYVPPLEIDLFMLHVEWAAVIALSAVISAKLRLSVGARKDAQERPQDPEKESSE